MTSQQITNFLKYPHLIDEQGISLLEKSIETYPYVGLFHMLYLKGLHNTKSIYFDKALERAALVINDRAKLHSLLYNPIPISSEEKSTDITDIKEEEIIDIVSDHNTEESEKTLEIKEIEKTPVLDPEMQLLQDIIVTEAIDHSIQADIDTIINEDFKEKKRKTSSIENHSEIEKSDKNPKSFGDWLNVMLPSDQEIEKTPPNKAPLKSSKELIDSFISSANKKIKVAANTPENIESASRSLEDKNDFATETLAQIYASQKKYTKAIEIYELLTLKFPEKKTFFASRIRFLRDKIEYDK